MESESNNKGKQNQKLELSDIFKEAIMIYFTNLNILIITFLTSLPLFCIMVFFEINLQQTVVQTSNILSLPHVYFSYYGSNPDFVMRRFNKDYFLKLIQLGFTYLVPLYFLELGSAIVTVNLASNLRSEEKNLTLKEMFEKPLNPSNLRGIFVTSMYVLFLKTTHQLGLLWIVINYHVFFKDLSFYLLFVVVCSVAFAKVLRIYLEWSAVWNMSLVISALEGIYGIDALALSAYFSRGCHRKGLFLMLIFFCWGHLLRLTCYHIGGYEQGNGVFVQVGLFCLVNPLKWVTLVIYFHDCKERKLEKRNDEESGKDVKRVVHE